MAEPLITNSGPRVLLEVAEGADATQLWQQLADNGCEVSWCPGPEGPPESWCPLMSERRCDLVDSADVVVTCLGFEHSACREVLARLHSLHPEAHVVVEASALQSATWPSLIDGFQVLRPPISAASLLESIELACGTRND